MKHLSEAIRGLYLANPDLAELVTEFYHTEAPKGTEYPYGTYSLVIDTKGHWFDAKLQNCVVRFNFFSKSESSSTVEDIADAFDAIYDECSLVIVTRDFGQCQRVTRGPLIKVSGVWQQTILYRINLIQTD